jgi:uncharacterized protein (TIGR00369 family)
MEYSPEQVLAFANSLRKDTLLETLDIEMCEIGVDYLVAKMPVNSRVHQPEGVLHGGATLSLAESVGSFAAHFFVDTDKYMIRGIEISANHVKSVSEGTVYARATFEHKGRTTQLFNIRVTDENDNLISLCKLTTITLPKSE